MSALTIPAIPITPDNATPGNCSEVLTTYVELLMEQAETATAPERARDIANALLYYERNLGYWLGFLVGPDGSATDEVREILDEIDGLREYYAASHEVPDIASVAQRYARDFQKGKRPAAKARSAAPAAPTGPTLPASTADTADDLEAALARAFDLTVEEYRALPVEEPAE